MSKPLFIHIPKNAGTAIAQSGLVVSPVKSFITDLHKNQDVIDDIRYTDTYKHLPYFNINRKTLNRFDKKIAVVRNPWSRMVSMYYYLNKISYEYPFIPDLQIYKNITFKEFLDLSLNYKLSPLFYRDFKYGPFTRQIVWLKGGLDIVDVIRYENLKNDIEDYFELQVTIPYVKVGSYTKDYKLYYDNESYDLVSDWFVDDINQWGFTFESAATKNYWKLK